MAAAAGNDATPVLGVFLESVSLEWIDLVADNTDNGHRGLPERVRPEARERAKAIFVTERTPTALRHVNLCGERAVRRISRMIQVAQHLHFVYHQMVNVETADAAASSIAAAIGEPARARMLYCLADGRARTSTELAMLAEVSPSTASVHLQRLMTKRLVKVFAQGKHRYYSLEGPSVAAALEALSVLAGGTRYPFVPNTPEPLRAARTCYDHIAGSLGVALHDRLRAMGWLTRDSADANAYELTPRGATALQGLGLDVDRARALRRRFAFACVDWSERRPHLGGALGAALLKVALKRRWVTQELDSRILSLTTLGRREMLARFSLKL